VARADVQQVTLMAIDPAYVGACPARLSFSITLAGDAGTIFGWQLAGDGISTTKQLFGYIPAQGSTSFNADVTIDAAHAGAHSITAKIRFGAGQGDTDLRGSIASNVVQYSVTCATPNPSPSATSGG